MALHLPLGCGISRSLLTVHELTPFTWPSQAEELQAQWLTMTHRLVLTTSAASPSAPTTLNSSNNELFMILYTHPAISELNALAHLIS